MNHLTTEQILEYVDGTILNGERTEVVAHLESCPRCKREVELQRVLAKSAREAPLAKPSRKLVDRIMESILPETKNSLARKLVNNLGNLLAMIVVLSIVGYAVSTPTVWKGDATPSVISQTFKTYNQFYDQVSRFLTAESARLQSRGSTPASRDDGKIIGFTIISLLALAALDKFVIRRVVKTKS